MQASCTNCCEWRKWRKSAGRVLVLIYIYLMFLSLIFFVKFWTRLMGVCLFSVQESAKAALKMKDCQMTDRTTQTEHMGPEVSHSQTVGTL